jgi:hypothetical protein
MQEENMKTKHSARWKGRIYVRKEKKNAFVARAMEMFVE